MMNMHNPPHPGEVLKELYLEPLHLTVTDAAKGLHITRKTLSTIINCRAGVSSEMALRLAKAFSTTAESWLNLQQHYNLWHSQQEVDVSDVKVFSWPQTNR